ncbi:hypothetical protein DKT77_13340 [Meridianimarinicoccus roseus]|uniref:Mutator family transposase n=1 Tax=Meridianimarinicoccus roseus TaxID=2072018 RepID=A0A2V2LI99_9RHOB|nr:hypothetical protein DKT77_13340 [Meridianimarinicoccus roseus]
MGQADRRFRSTPSQARRLDAPRRGRHPGPPELPTGTLAKIHSTNPLERLNKEIKRRANVVGILPIEAAVTRLGRALMLDQNDEWAIMRSYMTLETVAANCEPCLMTSLGSFAIKESLLGTAYMPGSGGGRM